MIVCNDGLVYICNLQDRVEVENLSWTGISVTGLLGMVYHAVCCSHSLILWKNAFYY